MPSSLPPETRAAVEALVASDPKLQAALRDLVHLSLRTITEQMTTGSPVTKLRAAQMFVGPLLNGLNEAKTDETLEALKAEIADMRAEAMAAWRGDVTPSPDTPTRDED